MKDKFISILFVSILFICGLWFVFGQEKSISFNERRKLITRENVKEDFFLNLDKYMNDQFIFRDKLISLDSFIGRYLFMNFEKNDAYLFKDYIIEKNYPYNEDEVNAFIKKVNYVNDNYLTNSNVFYSIVPDKSYFLPINYLKFDFDKLIDGLNRNLNFQYIDIMNTFVLEDYFKTDIHLKQGSYFKTLSIFDSYLDFGYKNLNYEENIFNNFYGSSFSKVPFVSSENIIYYTNEFLDSIQVRHLEYDLRDLYDLEKLSSMDSYNVFLSGPSAFLEIVNSKSLTDKELVIFRDSFASSLVPLLAPYYKKIVMVDLRYIDIKTVNNYVDFNDATVLFLFSTLIVNNGSILKI